jgi:hypothetical protein
LQNLLPLCDDGEGVDCFDVENMDWNGRRKKVSIERDMDPRGSWADIPSSVLKTKTRSRLKNNNIILCKKILKKYHASLFTLI